MTPTAPSHAELIGGAQRLITQHFDAIRRGDRTACRETMVLFDANDGEPFERWWTGMRLLAPVVTAVERPRVVERVSRGSLPHVAIWLHVRAASVHSEHAGDFVVWWLVAERVYRLGCRIHWWLPATTILPSG